MPDSILIIDGDSALIIALSKQLKSEGFESFQARDGLTGLEAAAAHRPDMIVLNIDMAGFQGIDVLRHLKSNPDLKDIPVMVLAADLDEDRRLEATEAGAAACLSKPLDGSDVLEAIRTQLGIAARSPRPRRNHQAP